MSRLCLSALLLLAMALTGGCPASPDGVNELLQQVEETLTPDYRPPPSEGPQAGPSSGDEENVARVAPSGDEECTNGTGEDPSAPAAAPGRDELVAPDLVMNEGSFDEGSTDGEYPAKPKKPAGNGPTDGADSGNVGEEPSLAPMEPLSSDGCPRLRRGLKSGMRACTNSSCGGTTTRTTKQGSTSSASIRVRI
jgi:hypothetical protein